MREIIQNKGTRNTIAYVKDLALNKPIITRAINSPFTIRVNLIIYTFYLSND